MTKIKIYVAGGSSAQSFGADRAPLAGWGQALDLFFTEEVEIINHAMSGKSSKSFVEEGRLQKISEQIAENDYLFIHFGHNDIAAAEERYTEPKTTFKQYMTMYIDVARERGAIPILVTPVNKRTFDGDGIVTTNMEAYAKAVRELGKELNVAVIDLAVTSKELLQQMGREWSQRLFLWLAPDEHPNYPEGKKDDSHFNEFGARVMAQLVVKELKESGLPLASFIR